MSKYYIAKRKSPPVYAFTIFVGEMSQEEKSEFDKIVLKDKKYWGEREGMKTWYDIYCINGEYYGIGGAEGHTRTLKDFVRCYCDEYNNFSQDVNS